MSESRVFKKLVLALTDVKLVSLTFNRAEFPDAGTRHRQNISVNQALSIVDGPDGALVGLGRAKISVDSRLFEPDRPHFHIECEYGGIFKIVASEPGLHANAEVSSAIVDATCGYMLPLVTAEIGRALFQSGLKLDPAIWSMEASRDLAAKAAEKSEASDKREERPKKRRSPRTKS